MCTQRGAETDLLKDRAAGSGSCCADCSLEEQLEEVAHRSQRAEGGGPLRTVSCVADPALQAKNSALDAQLKLWLKYFVDQTL